MEGPTVVPGSTTNASTQQPLPSDERSLLGHMLHWITSTLLWLWATASAHLSTPLLLLFVVPVLTFVFVYFSAISLYLHDGHKRRALLRIGEAVLHEHDLAKAGRELIAAFWDLHGFIWHSYEVRGIEKIPSEGAALIIYYHGALPVDYYYFSAKMILERQRNVHSVVDRFLFRIPGMRHFLRVFQCTPGTVETCTQELRDGHLLGLAPGGVYEALFSSTNYEIQWKSRVGFAKIALAVGCPIIPIFTQNVRESFRSFPYFRRLFKFVYSKTRLPLVPIYGGYPVKLITHVGDPVTYDPTMSAEELRDACRTALQDLILKHQTRPGSIVSALAQRFQSPTSPCGAERAHES